MANIIQLDSLVPEDLEFTYRGESYVIPGDLDGETVLKLFRMFGQLAQLMAKAGEDPGTETDARKAATEMRRISADVDKTLLELFRLRQPGIEKLPFGVKTMPIVIKTILEHLGLGSEEGNRVTRRATGRQKKTSSRARRAPASSR